MLSSLVHGSRWRRALLLALPPLLAWLALFLPLWAYLPLRPRAVLPLPSELPTNRAEFGHLVFSPDGQWLAGDDAYGTLRWWQVLNGKLVTATPCQPRSPRSRDPFWFSPDSKTLAVRTGKRAYGKHVLRLLDVRDGQEQAVIPPSGDEYFGQAEFSPDSSLLVTESRRRGLQVWEVATGEQRALLAEPGSVCNVGFGFSPDGLLLACQDARFLRLWDARTFDRRWTIPQAVPQERGCWEPWSNCSPRVMLFSGDRRLFATESKQGIRIWEMPTLRQRGTLSVPEEYLELDSLSRDGGLLVTVTHQPGDEDTPATTRYRIWDMTATPARQIHGALEARPRLLPTPGLVAVYDAQVGTVALLDVRQGRKLSTIPSSAGWREDRFATEEGDAIISPDGQYLAEEWYCVAAPSLFARWLPWLRRSPQGRREVILWNLRTGRQKACLGGCHFLGFSPEGGTLATRREDGSIALWDVPPVRSALLLCGPPSLLAAVVACLCGRPWRRLPELATSWSPQQSR